MIDFSIARSCVAQKNLTGELLYSKYQKSDKSGDARENGDWCAFNLFFKQSANICVPLLHMTGNKTMIFFLITNLNIISVSEHQNFHTNLKATVNKQYLYTVGKYQNLDSMRNCGRINEKKTQEMVKQNR